MPCDWLETGANVIKIVVYNDNKSNKYHWRCLLVICGTLVVLAKVIL
jgi:hypothetical protein